MKRQKTDKENEFILESMIDLIGYFNFDFGSSFIQENLNHGKYTNHKSFLFRLFENAKKEVK